MCRLRLVRLRRHQSDELVNFFRDLLTMPQQAIAGMAYTSALCAHKNNSMEPFLS